MEQSGQKGEILIKNAKKNVTKWLGNKMPVGTFVFLERGPETGTSNKQTKNRF